MATPKCLTPLHNHISTATPRIETHVGLVLEVDGVAVALLQDAGVEVVLVLRVQLPPAADVLARHVVAAHLRKRKGLKII